MHNRWELHFKDKADHYFPVFLEEHQANLIGEEMRKPGSVSSSDVAIAGIDFRVYKLESVVADDLKGGVLNTRLVLKYKNRHLQVNCPAEKAVVLALKEGVPILMEENGPEIEAN